MSLVSGTHLGPYEILQPIGAGGMGQVYKARDTRLHRTVAIKVLPAEFASRPGWKQRFEREAQTIASLNHPHICTLYDVGQQDSIDYLVMEFLEGQTLAQRLERGALPLDEALKIAIDVADALDKAHRQGIVHRDVKPGNIFITTQHLAKVMDFGLAKVDEAYSSSHAVASSVPTAGQLRENLTNTGAAMGTIAYMSPEQALGEDIDGRGDLFSLGVVLYEMSTGRHPFPGNTTAAIFDAILHKTPPSPMRLNAAVPSRFEEIIQKALEKDRDMRYQSAAELHTDLKRLRRDTESGRLPVLNNLEPMAKRRSRWLIPIIASILIVIALALLRQFRVSAPNGSAITAVRFTKLTTSPWVDAYPSFSPDGHSFVYASGLSPHTDIFLQRVGGDVPINLTKDAPLGNNYQPAFSPDGNLIAFRSGRDKGGIFIMGATGENVRRITDSGFNPAWSPNGKQVVYCSELIGGPGGRYSIGTLTIVDIATGVKTPIKSGDAVQPAWSPHGKRIAYWGLRDVSGDSDIWTIPAEGGEAVEVTHDAFTDWNPVWSPDGQYLYFSSDRSGPMNIWRVRIDENTGKTSGDFEPVTTPSSFAGHMSFSKDGHYMLYSDMPSVSNIYSMEFDPVKGVVVGEPKALTSGSHLFGFPVPSPDGWVTFGGIGPDHIFVVNADGSGLRQLTSGPYRDRLPTWSPDGQRIAFSSNRTGKYQVWTIKPDGSDPRQLTHEEQDSPVAPFWRPDGKAIGYFKFQSERTFILPLNAAGDGSAEIEVPAISADKLFIGQAWLPDGKRIGGYLVPPGTTNNPFGARQSILGIAVYDTESKHSEELTDRGGAPVWLNDDRRFFLRETVGTLVLYDGLSKKRTELPLPPHFAPWSISSDNRRLYLMGGAAPQGKIWMIDFKPLQTLN
jgi:serine/threonine protein kinase